MRRYLYAIVLLCVIAGLPMLVQTAPVTVQNPGNGCSGASTCAITTTSTTAGNLLVWIGVIRTDASQTINAPTDNQSNTYTQAYNVSCAFGNYRCAAYYVCNATGGVTSVTGNFSANTNSTGIVLEVSGIQTSSCLDQSDSTFGVDSSSPWAAPTVTTTVADNYLVNQVLLNNQPSGCAGTNGWTVVKAQANTGSGIDLCANVRIVSSTGSYTGEGTWTSGSTSAFPGMVTFKGVAASSTPAGPFRRRNP